MGALTLKSFPFELRGWDIEKFESIDPTDGFGINTRVYISKQQIIQIEPDYSETSPNTWLNDKGRQFFDSIFGVWNNKDNPCQSLVLQKKSWQMTIKILLKTLYLFEQCSAKTQKTPFLTIVFENLGIEMLSLLKIIEQNYSFVKLRRVDDLDISNDLEFNFQLNSVTNSNKLKASTLCLLIANNPRYEGSSLNLKLRQRYLKGNFKCLTLGSFIDLTFPNTVVGTNIKILKKISEGNSFICQDFRTANKPLMIFGKEFYNRTESKNIIEMLTALYQTNVFGQNWNGLNTLHPILNETGIQTIAKFLPLKKKDLKESSSFYFINVDAQNTPNLQKMTEAKLLNYTTLNKTKQLTIKGMFLDQNSNSKNNQTFVEKLLGLENNKKYRFLPVKMFYENKETFINTEGLIKKTNKLITKRKTREGWKLLRNLFSYVKHEFTELNYKSTNNLSFDVTKQRNFANFLNFHYCTIEKLDSCVASLATQTQPFFIYQSNRKFRQTLSIVKNSKTKYWLDDFFTGGKDEYSKNSLVLASCSKILRTQSTNFF